MSEQSIESGARWTPELEQRLRETNVGLIVVTPDSRDAPWLMFEAGAMSKLQEARPIPVVYGLSKALAGPLSQFQARDTSKKDIAALITDVNRLAGDAAINDTMLTAQFERCWPEFETGLSKVENAGTTPSSGDAPQERGQGEMIEEILLRVRDLQRELSERTGRRSTPRRLVPARTEVDQAVRAVLAPFESDEFHQTGSAAVLGQPDSLVIRYFGTVDSDTAAEITELLIESLQPLGVREVSLMRLSKSLGSE